MREQMIYGEPPTFPELIEKLKTLRWRFRGKKPIQLPPGITLAEIIEQARQNVIAEGWLKNPIEGTFMRTPVHYNLDIYEPNNSANMDRRYEVSFTFSKGKLMTDDVQFLKKK